MLFLRRSFSIVFLALAFRAQAIPDQKFDVVTFCCGCAPDDSMCQIQFDHLNIPTTNGHYIAMGSDDHRLDLATNGNALAIYYNTFNDGWPTNTGPQQAARIDQYAVSGFTSTGPKPNWVVLNEISSGLWQSSAPYRTWVRDVVHSLKTTYGYSVILYSPFPNPGANASDWQAITQDAYIGVENYLSGADVLAHGFSVSYCQSQYQTSIASYTNLGVARAQLMLGENFGQTTNGTAWGRSGVSSNDWDSAIVARNQGALNVGFNGYLTYAWSKDAMLVPQNEVIHFEDTFRTNQLPQILGLTAPFLVLPPLGQTAPAGANINFLAYRAGTAPTAYQWKYNGTNLPGATGSSLALTNIQIGAAGNYSVMLSNAAGTVLSSNAFLDVSVPDPFAFEPFAPAITTYSNGAPLIGQTNAQGLYWTQAGPASNVQPYIVAGSLPYPSLDGPSGNSVRFGQNGTSARFNLGTNTTLGTWYYSFVTRVADISGISASGVFWAGFNNASGTQVTTPSVVGTRVVTRSAPGGFNIGLDKSSGTAGNFAFATNVFDTNAVIFIVGSYTFNSATTTDDISQMWINPPSSTFGQANAPVPLLTATAGNDVSPISSFVLFDRNNAEPPLIYADEIRVGASWASVTPPAESAIVPALAISLAGTNAVLSWPTTAPGYILQREGALSSSSGIWTNVLPPVYISSGQFVVTNVVSPAPALYRLIKY